MPNQSDRTSPSLTSIGPTPQQPEAGSENAPGSPAPPQDAVAASENPSAAAQVNEKPPATNESIIRLGPPASPARSARPRSRAWMILPMTVAGVVVAVIIGAFMQPRQPQTITEVARQVSEIVLRSSDRRGVEDGGPVGPLWIAARTANMMNGTFADMQVRAGHIRLAARGGRLIVDPDENTISFALEQVVLVRIPDGRAEAEPEPEFGQSIMEFETFVLGPVPYKPRIVDDGHPAGKRASPGRLAGVQ